MIERQRTIVRINTQKTLFEIRRKKTMMIKIIDVIEKTLFRSMIIKNLMQKLTTMKKKKKHNVDETFAQRRLEAVDKHEKDEKKMKKNQTLTFDINSFATIVRRTYVVLTHEMRREDINVIIRQEIINHIIKQSLNLHKEMNIIKVA